MKFSGSRYVWLALHRLHSRAGLTLLSLLSVVLSVGMVASIPIFSQGISYLVLREELEDLGNAVHRPPLTIRFYFLASREQPISLRDAQEMERRFTQLVASRVGLPIKQVVTLVRSPLLAINPVAGDLRYGETDDDGIESNLYLMVVSDIKDHIEIVEGAPFGETGDGERLPVWPYGELADETGLHVGETYDMVEQGTGQVVPVYIAGIWQQGDRNDFYWNGPTVNWRSAFLVTGADYETFAQPRFASKTHFNSWYIVPDDRGLTLDRADRAAGGLEVVPNIADTILPTTRMDVSPVVPLRNYVQRKNSLSALLVGFSLPALGLLFYFLSLISTVTVQFQREEAAILTSRGTGRTFLMGLAGIETLILIGVGLPLGLGLGYGMAQVMGFASDFLTFVRRTELPATLLGVDLRLLTGALLVLIATRLVPTLCAARRSIVIHLQEWSRPVANTRYLKLAVDIPLVVATAYAYQQLSQRGSLGVIGWEPSGNPFRDPLLLLAPSFFVFTAALLLAHLFPTAMRPVDSMSGKLRSFSSYMGFRRLRRQSEQYTSPLFLVMVCLSLGAFYSSMALSLDRWMREHIYYEVGTDYRFELGEPPDLGSPGLGDASQEEKGSGAWLVPISDYLAIPGVKAATRVGEFQVSYDLPNGPARGARFLGIGRVDFLDVAYFRQDFTESSLGVLMNRLGMYPNGLLVSRHFLDQTKLVEGQRLTLNVRSDASTQTIEFLIVGVYDYFPTAFPEEEETFVGNLDFLFERIGDVSLHDIWLRTEPGTDSDTILERVTALGIYPTHRGDASLMVLQDEERVERIGLFGVLSIGFLAGSILSWLGLLVYTYASLQGRLQQISVLRAMGVRPREVLAMEGIEYATVIAYSVIGGTVIGAVASYLFVPFFQISTEPALALPPFLPQIAWGKIVLLSAIFAAALVVSQVIILYGATRKDIFQILRMGQRE